MKPSMSTDAQGKLLADSPCLLHCCCSMLIPGVPRSGQDSWPPLCDQSKLAPAQIIIQSVTPVPSAGQEPTIVLHNMGGRVANITGWVVDGPAYVPSETHQDAMYIADSVRCRANGSLVPGSSIVFTPQSDQNPCGFPFSLGTR